MTQQNINYTWKVLSLKRKNTSDFDGVIIQVIWNKIGVDSNGNDGVYLGSTSFDLATIDPDNFISYSDLTEEVIIEWIKSSIDDEYEANIHKLIADQIDEKASAVVQINSGFPWETEPVGISTTA